MSTAGGYKTPCKEPKTPCSKEQGVKTPSSKEPKTPSSTSTPGSGSHTPMSERQQLALLRTMEEEGGKGKRSGQDSSTMTGLS